MAIELPPPPKTGGSYDPIGDLTIEAIAMLVILPLMLAFEPDVPKKFFISAGCDISIDVYPDAALDAAPDPTAITTQFFEAVVIDGALATAVPAAV